VRTLADGSHELAALLEGAHEDDRQAIEAAYLATLATAPRHRPVSLPPLVRSHRPERVAAARARGLAADLAVRRDAVADSLSTREVAAHLGVSPAAVTTRRIKGGLVAFRHAGHWRYPSWQFRGGELVPGVEIVWRALPDHDTLSLTRWFTLPSRHLGGATPLETLAAGDVERVADAASYVGSR
jgi:hypothetical protein